GKVLWTFQTGHQIAAGPSIYSVDGTEYIAITSGGTPTSSSGGTATQLQVFSLGGSQTESPPPELASFHGAQPATRRTPAGKAARPARQAAPQGRARLSTPAALVVRPWTANSSNVQSVQGRVTLDGRPVAGARVTIGGYTVPRSTAGDGMFHYDLDYTVP